MAYKVKEVANLVGISVRTLHHYDEIDLLKPDQISEAGYRLYSEEDLAVLQQILFFRELDFPLKKIKDIITNPDFDQEEALHLHRSMLLEKRSRLDQLLASIDKTILHMKGEIRMSQKEKFEGFDFSSNPYEQEARNRWGDKAVDESNQKISNLTKGEQKNMKEEMNHLFIRMAAIRHLRADSSEAQALMDEWFTWLNKMGTYSKEGFKGLGQLYVDDPRFTKNIDQFGEGLSLFLRDAMAFYSDTKGL
ncbi:MerR family transcriptional regulator [Jeotgalibacillus proteolyticus]|uniref:MerR family transcriptional regulator n=1 Tax=Jeotgalibacillus proteolyticus TaxID=2082395 RepID=A0A2S5GCN3_9BACL|nr:MerR family transcriptional regulator [Jeotgalibacillus proteolyticus]PPA70756.1 MerR family transcriptional regulator [Jeotgalibacillus proteolyticus]